MIDGMLQFFAKAADTKGVSVTLTVGGLLVTGNLASPKAFTDGTMGVVAAMSPKSADAAKEVAAMLEQLRERENQSLPDDDPRKNVLSFISLSEARFLTPAGVQPREPNPGIWWRCRVEDVSGFALGRLF